MLMANIAEAQGRKPASILINQHVDNPGQTPMKDDDMQVNDEINPRYTVMPAHGSAGTGGNSMIESAATRQLASAPLPTFNGSFVFNGTTFSYNMVGSAPTTNTSTTVQAIIIPLKIVVTRRRVTTTFDPAHTLSNGQTVVSNTTGSPLFVSTAWSAGPGSGTIPVGTTQYIDAFQRANFWGTVQNLSGYHLLLGGPTVLAEQTINVSSKSGTTGTPFGHTAGLVDINFFDGQVQNLLSQLTQIQPNTLPIFLINDVYLTQNGSCCIGGYHSINNNLTQAYSVASYVDHPGDFAEDISALSHEIGEWADDPLVVNTNGNSVSCGTLEVGDPLENNSAFGTFPVTLNGFTYNPQDLVFLTYFGAPASTSAGGFLSFRDATNLSVCSNGG
jgi:hypothetical protein